MISTCCPPTLPDQKIISLPKMRLCAAVVGSDPLLGTVIDSVYALTWEWKGREEDGGGMGGRREEAAGWQGDAGSKMPKCRNGKGVENKENNGKQGSVFRHVFR